MLAQRLTMTTLPAAAAAHDDEGIMALSTTAPELVHDGESYRIYRATLQSTRFGNHSTKKESQQQISVAIKTCQTNGYSDALSNLNNEYNILKLGQMVNCHSARSVLNKDQSFHSPDQADTNEIDAPATTAIYLEWVEGVTLSKWLEGGKQQDGILTKTNSDMKDESSRLLDKVRIASKLADAVANIHEAGVVHNDLNGDNVIVSFGHNTPDFKNNNSHREGASSFQVTIIDFEYADQSSGLEGNDDGDRVNDDIPQLASLLRDVFSIQEGGEDHSNSYGDTLQSHGASSTSSPLISDHFLKRLSFGNAHGDFSRTFRNDNDKDDGLDSTRYDSKNSSVASTDAESLTNSNRESHIFGVTQASLLGHIDEVLGGNRRLPRNLPRSVRRVLTDIQDAAGHGTSETMYHNSREVAEDLHQMASDPAVFLADPKRGDTDKNVFRKPPLRLYGRETELAILRDAESRLMDENRGGEVESRTEVILIAGRSGTGKSSLLRQARSESSGVFVVGKFDQLQSMQPYSALVEAFDQVVHSILAEDADVIAHIKECILKVVAKNGKVLTDLIPSLAKIIGEQPKVINVTGIEAQNRFRYIVQCFARAICTPRRPLIFVLDDLQWCDSASIDLLQALVTDQGNMHMLFIGCYRDDEMDADHKVSVQFDLMKKANVKLTTIKLDSLDLDSLTSFVSERLHLPRRLVKSMSEIVHRKSLGNAFFASTFLQSLAESGLLTFSRAKMRWVWDEVGADANSISDDVVEVMAEKILTLQPVAQEVLKAASCIGATFDSSIVKSLMSDTSHPEKYLAKLAKQGLIIKVIHNTYSESVVQYKFSHDRIQQASYSLIPNGEKEALHLCIGTVVKKRLSATSPSSLVYKAVDQLNRGSACIVDREEQVELAILNAKAAEEAYNECAFILSKKYCHKSIGILGGEHIAWKDHYDLALTLYNLLAELNYCKGNFDVAMQITRRIFKRAKTFDDQFIAQMCDIKSRMLKGDLDGALTTSLGLLAALGEPLPKKPSIGVILASLIKTKKLLWRGTDEYLASLPKMKEERIMKVTEVFVILSQVAYLLGSDYYPIITFKGIWLTLKYGQNDISALAFTSYGLLLYAILKDAKGAWRFGHLGLSLSSRAVIPRTHMLLYGLIIHWRVNIENTLGPLLNGFKEGLKSGDIEYAWLNAVLYNVNRLHGGTANIHSIIQQQKMWLQELTKAAQYATSDLLRPIQQAAINLTGQSRDPVVLTGEVMDEDGLLKRSAESANISLEYSLRATAACVAYIFDDYNRASMHSRKIQDIADKSPGIYTINVQAFYDGMSSYAIAKTATDCKKWRKRGRKTIKKFVKWMKDCPSNNAHKVLLLKAEDASLFAVKSKKKREIAEHSYNAAILSATDNGFVNIAAIASERAAEFYINIGEDELFYSHIAQAHKLYFKWGAVGKCECIAKKYPGIAFNTQDAQ